MTRNFKRQEAWEIKKYTEEYQTLVHWFLCALFGSDAAYDSIYSYAHETWKKYCEIAEFKALKPDPFKFHKNFKPLERI